MHVEMCVHTHDGQNLCVVLINVRLNTYVSNLLTHFFVFRTAYAYAMCIYIQMNLYNMCTHAYMYT